MRLLHKLFKKELTDDYKFQLLAIKTCPLYHNNPMLFLLF